MKFCQFAIVVVLALSSIITIADDMPAFRFSSAAHSKNKPFSYSFYYQLTFHTLWNDLTHTIKTKISGSLPEDKIDSFVKNQVDQKLTSLKLPDDLQQIFRYALTTRLSYIFKHPEYESFNPLQSNLLGMISDQNMDLSDKLKLEYRIHQLKQAIKEGDAGTARMIVRSNPDLAFSTVRSVNIKIEGDSGFRSPFYHLVSQIKWEEYVQSQESLRQSIKEKNSSTHALLVALEVAVNQWLTCQNLKEDGSASDCPFSKAAPYVETDLLQHLLTESSWACKALVDSIDDENPENPAIRLLERIDNLNRLSISDQPDVLNSYRDRIKALFLILTDEPKRKPPTSCQLQASSILLAQDPEFLLPLLQDAVFSTSATTLSSYFSERELSGKDHLDITLAHYAVLHNKFTVLEYLLSRGVIISDKNAEQLSLFEMAMKLKCHSMTEFYLRHGDLHDLLESLDNIPSFELTPLQAELLRNRVMADSTAPEIVIRQLIQKLISEDQMSIWILAGRDPCSMFSYSDQSPIMNELCKLIESSPEADSLVPSSNTENLTFRSSLLHFTAAKLTNPHMRSMFKYVVNQGIDHLHTDSDGKTFLHYLIEQGEYGELFRSLIHIRTQKILKPHVHTLLEEALRKGDQPSVTVLQLFGLNLLRADSCSLFSSETKREECRDLTYRQVYRSYDIALQLGREHWLHTFYGVTDGVVVDGSIYNLGLPDELRSNDLINDHVSKLRFLTDRDNMNLTQIAHLLSFGANPMECTFDSDYKFRVICSPELLYREYRTDNGKNDSYPLVLSFLFGANHTNINDAVSLNNPTGPTPMAEKHPFLKEYYDALINPDKTTFNKNTTEFQRIASAQLEDIGVTGNLSQVHPVCTSLTLKKSLHDGSPDPSFAPFTQKKARQPGDYVIEALTGICNEYPYTEFGMLSQ